jgi:drug/metabolite transporter (DMT)-like permease
LLARIFLGERVRSRTWVAIVLAFLGVMVMVGGTAHGSVRGDAWALVSATAFAASVVLIRRHADISMIPATALSQLLVVAATAPFAHFSAIGWHSLALVAVFGVVQMAGGLALFTVAARLIPVIDLTLIVLLELILGPLWVWMAFAQVPSAATMAGGCIVVAAVALQTTGDGRPVAA